MITLTTNHKRLPAGIAPQAGLYQHSANTFLGNSDAPPWVVTSLYNTGTTFKIATASTPSSQFISDINSLTIGSQITVVDGTYGTFTITLTSDFSGTFTTAGNETYSANCISSPSGQTLSNITSMNIAGISGDSGYMLVGSGSAGTSYTYYGAMPYYSIGSISTINSAIDTIWYTDGDPNFVQNGYVIIEMTNGTHPDFTVSAGSIDGDAPGYPRIFKINGVDYEFIFSSYFYFNSSNPESINLKGEVGNTISIVYDTASQYTPAANTFKVAYHRIRDYSGADNQFGTEVYGSIINSVGIIACYWNPMDSKTNILMTDGTYTGYTVTYGAINNDAMNMGKVRKFTVNNEIYLFTWDGYYYSNTSYDILGLQSKVNQTLSLTYDDGINVVPGGPGTNYSIIGGSWGYPGGGGGGQVANTVTLYVSSSQTAAIAALDALTVGRTIWIGQQDSNFAVTLTTVPTKGSIPPGWKYTFNTNQTNPDPYNMSYFQYLDYLNI